MDLRAYFDDMNSKEAEFKVKYKENIVHVTSLFHRERNSTAGNVISATRHNAARVITDGTHRESTPEEVAQFNMQAMRRDCLHNKERTFGRPDHE